MNKVEEIFNNAETIKDYATGYANYLAEVLKGLDMESISAFTQLMLEKREKGNTVYFIGNGGSAATASHFANDFSIGTRTTEKHFKAVSLTDNVPVMTAIGNDFGYDELFSRQLKVVMQPGDALVCISASGNSRNIIEAIKVAKDLNNTVVGLVGFDGGELKAYSDICIHVETQKGEYGPVEDVHMFVDHLVGNYLIETVKKEIATAN